MKRILQDYIGRRRISIGEENHKAGKGRDHGCSEASQQVQEEDPSQRVRLSVAKSPRGRGNKV